MRTLILVPNMVVAIALPHQTGQLSHVTLIDRFTAEGEGHYFRRL